MMHFSAVNTLITIVEVDIIVVVAVVTTIASVRI
jgi:hypothetical protein